MYSRWAVILALTHIYTPFTLMPIYAVLEAIPRGAQGGQPGSLRRSLADLLRIILPLSLPGVLAGSTFAFVLSMGDFLAPQLLGGNDSALMVSNLVWSLFGVAYNWPLGAAVSVVVLLLTLFLLWLANRVETAMNYGGQAGGRTGGRGGRPGRGDREDRADERPLTALRPPAPRRPPDRLSSPPLAGRWRRVRVHLSAPDGGHSLRLPPLTHHCLAARAGDAQVVRSAGARPSYARGRCWPA